MVRLLLQFRFSWSRMTSSRAMWDARSNAFSCVVPSSCFRAFWLFRSAASLRPPCHVVFFKTIYSNVPCWCFFLVLHSGSFIRPPKASSKAFQSVSQGPILPRMMKLSRAGSPFVACSINRDSPWDSLRDEAFPRWFAFCCLFH